MIGVLVVLGLFVWFMCTKSKVEETNEKVRLEFLEKDIVMNNPPDSKGVAIGIMFFTIVGTFGVITLLLAMLGEHRDILLPK